EFAHQSESGKSREMHLQTEYDFGRGGMGRRPGAQYVVPSQQLIHISTLDNLIAGARIIVPAQQARFQADEKLWCVGATSLLKKRSVAIVGTREVSADGRARSRRLGRELAMTGAVVVSGLAKVVDTDALSDAI